MTHFEQVTLLEGGQSGRKGGEAGSARVRNRERSLWLPVSSFSTGDGGGTIFRGGRAESGGGLGQGWNERFGLQ